MSAVEIMTGMEEKEIETESMILGEREIETETEIGTGIGIVGTIAVTEIGTAKATGTGIEKEAGMGTNTETGIEGLIIGVGAVVHEDACIAAEAEARKRLAGVVVLM